jgi:hypothetical protein
MTNEKVEIIITDDNHRVFDINKIPVSIDAIIEHLAYVGRWVGAVPDSEFNFEEHLKINDYPLVGWSSADAGIFMKAYTDKNGVDTIEYNTRLSEEVQRYAIVYGIVAHELGFIKELDVLSLSGFDSTNLQRRVIHLGVVDLLLPYKQVKQFILDTFTVRGFPESPAIVKKLVSDHFAVPIEVAEERLIAIWNVAFK